MEGDARIRREGKLLGGWNIMVNDYYGRHIVKNVINFVSPDYVFVLGDLFSYQHLTDPEFKNRVDRYNWLFDFSEMSPQPKLINITGNHDIGYGYESMVNVFQQVTVLKITFLKFLKKM